MSVTAIIHSPTNDLEQSKEFYNKLNFKMISESSPTLFSDGQVFVEVNPDRFARTGLKLYGSGWKDIVSKLPASIEIEGGFIVSDPNGVLIYLMESEFEGFEKPEEKTGVTGNFAGLSIEALDIEATCNFWESLGYGNSQGDISQGWVVYSNGSNVDVSIMKMQTCPHLFFNPGMTYFNGGKNPEIIQKIRDAGIRITEEISHFNANGDVDNIIIQDPGGLGFFLFND